MMKSVSKLLLIVLIVCLLLSLAACPNIEQSGGDGTQNGGGEHMEEYAMTITIGNKQFAATLSDSQAAQEFTKLLPLTLDMSELNGNEKYYYMSTTLPTNAQRVDNIHEGDIMLYGNSCIVLFYKSFSTTYSYTRIGKIDNVTGLSQAVGNGNVTVTFQID